MSVERNRLINAIRIAAEIGPEIKLWQIDVVAVAAHALAKVEESDADFEWGVEPMSWECVCAAIAKHIEDMKPTHKENWYELVRALLR